MDDPERNAEEKSEAVFERRNFAFGPGDMLKLEHLTEIARGRGLQNVSRSTILRALIRLADSGYNGTIYPSNASQWAIHFHEALPEELRQMQMEGARRGPKPRKTRDSGTGFRRAP